MEVQRGGFLAHTRGPQRSFSPETEKGEDSDDEKDPKEVWLKTRSSSSQSYEPPKSSKDMSEGRVITPKKQNGFLKGLEGLFKGKEKGPVLEVLSELSSVPDNIMVVENRGLKPRYEGAHIASLMKRWNAVGTLQQVVPSEYKCDYKGCYPFAIDTDFSFKDLNGFHPIYLKEIRSVYLLEDAGKRWAETFEYGVKDSQFKSGYTYNTLTYKNTITGEQAIVEVQTVIGTSVKRWKHFQSFSKIAKKKEFKDAVAEKTIAFVELKEGKVERIHFHADFYRIMKEHKAEGFSFDIKAVIKQCFLIMPRDYEIKTYDDEGYEALIAKFKRSV